MKEIREQKIKREKKDRSKKKGQLPIWAEPKPQPTYLPEPVRLFLFFPELTGGAPCQYRLPRVDLAQRPSPPSSV
jgi:hypothetical protein